VGYRLPNPQWDGELRKCVVCGVQDRPIYAGYASTDPGDLGQPVFEHSVVLEFYFCKDLTAKDKADGYLPIKLDGGRAAKIRAICLTCQRDAYERDEVWRDFKKSQRESDEQSREPSFYFTLCSE
jgi:hypothetical protein